jgi:hypothetical protein
MRIIAGVDDEIGATDDSLRPCHAAGFLRKRKFSAEIDLVTDSFVAGQVIGRFQ